MTFAEWWEIHYADVPNSTFDRTFGEEVWNAAQDNVEWEEDEGELR